jgi:hypothetical protein
MDWLTGAGILLGIATGVGGLWLGIDNRRTHERELQERETDRANLRSSYRALVLWELEQNLSALRAFWNDKVLARAVGTPLEQHFQQRRGMIDTPLPAWRRSAWDKLTPELALAFEQELLPEIDRFYRLLDALVQCVPSLAASMPDRLEPDYDLYRRITPPQYQSIENSELRGAIQGFVNETQPVWIECEYLYQQLDNTMALQPPEE